MNGSREAAFEHCLEQIQAGGSLEAALSGVPEWAGELQPMLETVQAARAMAEQVLAPAPVMARSRARFLAEAARRGRTGRDWRGRSRPWRGPAMPWGARSAAPRGFVLLGLLLLLFGSLGATAASARSLPGQPLYTIKRLSERARLLATSGAGQRLELERSFERERLEELEALTARERVAPVDFSGPVSVLQAGEWQVAGLRVRIVPETDIRGAVENGLFVRVNGRLEADGSVTAAGVSVWELLLSGRLEEKNPDGWVIDGVLVRVPADLQAETAEVGSRVSVSAVLRAGGSLEARSISAGSPGEGPQTGEEQAPSRTPESDPGEAGAGSSTPRPPEEDQGPGESQTIIKTADPGETGEDGPAPEPDDAHQDDDDLGHDDHDDDDDDHDDDHHPDDHDDDDHDDDHQDRDRDGEDED